MKACTAVIVEACPVEGCPEEELREVGHGGGSVFFECPQGHFLTIDAATVREMLED